MTYVIAQPCVGQKNTSCVDVCPVDCIHPAPGEPGFDEADMLHIDPEECIDCGVCAEACPEDAVFADSELPAEWADYERANSAWFR